jgi:hypothetical protein
MADEHASIAVSTLVARSQRSHGVSAALADRHRASNVPAARIQASRRDLSATYDFDMSLPSLESPGRIVLSATELLLNLHRTMLQAYFRPPALALATCPPFRRIAASGLALLAFAAMTSQVRPKFHHPTGLKTIDPVDNLVSPLGMAQARGHLRPDDSIEIAAGPLRGVAAGRPGGDPDDLLHPAQAFEHPSHVVNDPDLTINEKRAILASWASDACAPPTSASCRRCWRAERSC